MPHTLEIAFTHKHTHTHTHPRLKPSPPCPPPQIDQYAEGAAAALETLAALYGFVLVIDSDAKVTSRHIRSPI
jgi:hypothetical protein